MIESKDRTYMTDDHGEEIAIVENTWTKFRKRPVVIEAYQTQSLVNIRTLEGWTQAKPGDWILRGIKKEIYPCRDDIFKETYEEVE